MSRQHLYPPSTRHLDLGKDNAKVVEVAQDVAIERGTVMCEVLFHIAAIRSLQTTPATGTQATVRCIRAALQSTQGTDGHQAAHLLPGSIVVNEKQVWTLVNVDRAPVKSRHEFERVVLATQQCFARTTVLPAVFNKADSQAEQMAQSTSVKGLKELFGSITAKMWTNARVDATRPLAIDREAVLSAAAAWFSDVNAVYRAASNRKTEQSDAEAARNSGKSEKRALEAIVLDTYANSFSVANVARFIESHAAYIHRKYDWL